MAKRRTKSAQNTERLPVIIRFEGRGSPKKADWHRQDLVAFFPTEAGTNDPYFMTCYSPLGQHSYAGQEYFRKTKPATAAQVKALLSELRSVGYKNLKVVKRLIPAYLAVRKMQTK